MRSKNARAITAAEREHLARVKSLPCSVCDEPAPSSAHHIKQGQHFTTIALCQMCHTGYNGWHGTKALWNVRKITELTALGITIQRLLNDTEKHDWSSF